MCKGMSAENGRCEFEHLDYCCPPEWLTKSGFKCSRVLPIQEGEICEKCGCPDNELMTEEEWELQERCTNTDCHDEPSNENDCTHDCPHMILCKVPVQAASIMRGMDL